MSEIVDLKITHLPTQNYKLGDTGIEITPNALQVFEEAAKEENQHHIRIGVKGGGCSGFMYNIDFIDARDIDPDEDLVFNSQSPVFVIDTFSKEYLKGTVINHISSLKETGFKFENPQSKRTCGCGSSFSV